MPVVVTAIPAKACGERRSPSKSHPARAETAGARVMKSWPKREPMSK